MNDNIMFQGNTLCHFQATLCCMARRLLLPPVGSTKPCKLAPFIDLHLKKKVYTKIYTNIKRFGFCQTFKARSCEGDLALLSIIHRKALQHEASKAGASATAASVVHTESLQASTGSPLTNIS